MLSAAANDLRGQTVTCPDGEKLLAKEEIEIQIRHWWYENPNAFWRNLDRRCAVGKLNESCM